MQILVQDTEPKTKQKHTQTLPPWIAGLSVSLRGQESHWQQARDRWDEPTRAENPESSERLGREKK
jgi:hypothetical protein